MKGAEKMICRSCHQEFVIGPSDSTFYEKVGVPHPTFCPACRYQRRIANRNEWNFYKRKCDLCEKDMVSIYNPSYPGPVYCNDCWWSDKWDPLSYGREYDFSRPFFEQFFEHRYRVPRITLANSNSINSEYSNQAEDNKDCYMVVATGTSENCMYGNWNQGSKDCVDCWAMNECEIMYESSNCRKCYHCLFTDNSSDSNNCSFCRDCRGCTNCFGCIGLRNKSYCWFNEQLAKEEYLRRLNAMTWTAETIEAFKNQLSDLSLRLPVKYYHGDRIVDSTGDYLSDSKNVKGGFNCRWSENLSYGEDAWKARDCMDMTETLDNELDYEMEGAGWGARCIASSKSWYNNDILYSELNFNCHDIFGCLALRKKSYCILNKQYTESEYSELKRKLIDHMKKTGEWGEFFPVAVSPFPYNDSLAQHYFPLAKEEVLSRGWKWYDRDAREYQVTMEHQGLPATIEETTDDILKKTISCVSQDSEGGKRNYLRCATAFRIHPAELQFYRKTGLPLPHRCFACRLQDRLNRRNPRKLWHRACMCGLKNHFHGEGKCLNEFETSYSPEGKEIIYCEQCYNSEVV